MNNIVKYLGLSAGIMSNMFVCAATKPATANKEQITAAQAVISKANLSIYTVNFSEVYNKFYKAEEAERNFNSTAQQVQNELEKMKEEGRHLIEEIQELQKKLNNDVALDETAKSKINADLNAKLESLQKKEGEINQFRQEKDEKLAQQRQAVLSEIFKELNTYVEVIAKQQNADFVINSSGVGILYAKPEYDITQKVIEMSNKSAPHSSISKK